MDLLDELGESVRRVADEVGPSVVGIGQGWGRGSGTVVGEGRVLTNAHNVRAEEVPVVFADGRTATASVQGRDVDHDLALLAVDAPGVPAVAWSEDQPARGTAVFALANPAGRGLRVTVGLVSATGQAFRGPRGRRLQPSFEHTAPLPRGSSGGPVVDGQGRMVGVNTHRLGEGFYLALPADTELRARVERLDRGESPAPVHLGVGLAPPAAARRLRQSVGLPEREGLLVRAVQQDSPAERAGIRVGDLLVSAGGRALAVVDHLHQALDGIQPNATLSLGLVRGVEELELTVRFG